MAVDTLRVSPPGWTSQEKPPSSEVFKGPRSFPITVIGPLTSGSSFSFEIKGANATPAKMELGSLHHPRLRLRRGLELRVEHDDDIVAVWNPDLEEFGYGPYVTAAIEDFQRSVAELYFSLKDDQRRLGPDMLRLWHLVEGIVEERE